MKNRHAASMRSISAFSLALVLALGGTAYATSPESLKQAVVQAYEESSQPLFDPGSMEQQPLKVDRFFDKIRRDRAEFYKEERERRREFLEKIRKKTNWSDEKRQQEVVKYHKDEMQRLEKFMKEQQKKIDKNHQTINL